VSDESLSIFKVGLTGGIASGKSAVSGFLEQWGVPIIDADVIAREVVLPGTPALAALENMFGADIITSNNELDRAGLRKIIFDDPAARKRVESILHPAIRKRSDDYIAQYAVKDVDYLVCSVPLLVESAQMDRYDRILVVDVPEEVQIARIMQRDQVSEADALKILQSQTSRHKRLEAADDVITNDGTLDTLRDRVSELHIYYKELAKQKQGDNSNVVWLAPRDNGKAS